VRPIVEATYQRRRSFHYSVDDGRIDPTPTFKVDFDRSRRADCCNRRVDSPSIEKILYYYNNLLRSNPKTAVDVVFVSD
jgi:hypothetical protein